MSDLSSMTDAKLWERRVSLRNEVAALNQELTDVTTELRKRLDDNAQPVAVVEPRATRSKKDATNTKQHPSLKAAVQEVLKKNPDGLELKGIVAGIQEMKNRGEYSTEAKSISAVVSQAVNQLKTEKAINHDRDTKKYSMPAA